MPLNEPWPADSCCGQGDATRAAWLLARPGAGRRGFLACAAAVPAGRRLAGAGPRAGLRAVDPGPCRATGSRRAGVLRARPSRRAQHRQPGPHLQRRLRRHRRGRGGVRCARHAEPGERAAGQDPRDHRQAGEIRRAQPLPRRSHLRPASLPRRDGCRDPGPDQGARLHRRRQPGRRGGRPAPGPAARGAGPVGERRDPHRAARPGVQRRGRAAPWRAPVPNDLCRAGPFHERHDDARAARARSVRRRHRAERPHPLHGQRRRQHAQLACRTCRRWPPSILA